MGILPKKIKLKKKRGFKGWFIKFRTPILITVAVLVLIRLALPYVILHFANKKLANLDGYHGHIEDVDLALIRGAYTIDEINIRKVDSAKQDTTKFFWCKEIDLSVDWRALFEGKIVGEVIFDEAELTFTKDKTVGKKAEEDTTDFIKLVKDFIPLQINRFEVKGSQLSYEDKTRQPNTDIEATEIYILGTGLTNHPEEGENLPADIKFRCALYDGKIAINVKLDPLSKVPYFDMNGDLSQLNLVNFNNLFKAYGNFDVKKGNMSLYTEIATKNNEVTGYVKPIIKDLDVVQFNKEEGKPLQIAWEALLGSVAEIFQNQPTEQLATRLEFEGKLNKPDMELIPAIWELLRNAFFQALKASIDHSVNIQTVGQEDEKEDKKFRLFKGKDKKDKEEEKE